ncbi:efflux RND transporter periplasmic adaptor subunit [Noviherbaspirillum cavernae]|uniref:Efflux RND transporter periplasmic adaptor subunit n=1 Tax=Noviherbaspirillum cavernae TaxID=2320862 RepID=A0A418WYY7_9BURK|nr:efflux RND transporter periplasmic adaptor subunit [Noviherbaspirillum cavernae]RJG05454.1 efflux RND transporter periplasmic adaptor subunit [Noviherbaspirillum cavernae]
MKNVSAFTHAARSASTALLLSGTAALVLSGCGQPSAQEVGQQPAGGPPITAATVIEKQVVETQEFSGRLEAVDHVEIRPRVSGFIASVNFKPGAEVRKGDVLFVIDPRPYEAEASRTEAAALAARAKADLAKIELVRAEKLVAERAIAQREADEKASSMKELEAGARAAQATYEAAKLNLGFTKVHSPINGRVSKAEITTGNLVDGSVVLTSVVSNKQIYASFDGDEESFLRVGALARKGTPVTVRIGLANESGFPHEGRLEFVDNRVDPATGSVRMRAVFANADNALAPGLFARVQLASGNGMAGASNAAMISDRAVGTDQNRKFVYVVTADGKAEYRAVKLGPVVDGLRVVRDGVKPGEKIVVNGLQRVRPGAPVTAQMVSMDADQNQPQAAPKAEVKADTAASKS